MAPSSSRRRAVLAAILAVAVIGHGSLWPYQFRIPPGPVGPVDALLGSWRGHPSGLGDILANVLFYVPFGLFGALSVRAQPALKFLLVVGAGALLSVVMELTQFYDADRVTSLWDLGSNTAGTALGAAAGLLLRVRTRIPLLQKAIAHPVPSLLLGAMLGDRLVPYVPVIDLHKYWNALKPVVFGPMPEPAEMFRYFAVWLTVSELLAAIFGAAASVAFTPLLVGFVLACKILIYGSVVTRAELAGAGAVVLLAWPILHRRPGRTPLVACVLLASVVIERLQPFAFGPVPRPFGWLPFRAFLGGSLLVNTGALFEKVFLYGSLVYLLARAGMGHPVAAALVAAILFGTSYAEVFLPGRSAEITDTLIALLAAGLIALLEVPRSRTAPVPAPRYPPAL